HRPAARASAGVATAGALPVTLLSVGGGVAAHEIAQLQQSGYQVAVSGAGVHGLSGVHGLARGIANITDVAWASPILSSSIDLFYAGGGATPALAEGVIPGAFSATQPPAERSILPDPLPLGDPTDLVHFSGGTYTGAATLDVLVSSPLSRALGIGVGASVVLSPDSASSDGTPYRVTGVFGVPAALLGPTAADAVILPLSDLQVLTGVARSGNALLDEADTVQVALTGPATTSPAAVDRVASQIQALAPYYGVTSLTQQAEELEGSQAILNGFYLALSSVSLTVGFLFLALVLVRRVESDRASIAVRRAIGVPARQIAGEMIGRGLRLAIAGAVGGLVGGYLVVEALDTWGTPNVTAITSLARFDPLTLGLVVVGVVLLSLPASGAATRAALKLSVPEALR
ncbi:MAG TPA: FtsX-like permease family protein, partial [Thermoplasmata archaeon]|nr:FtsX-like permease family protein [Thermoplasmata archaeon]